MTRTRNSAYQGVSIFDADPDAIAFQKCMRETAQDFHLAYDLATGENGVSSSVTMNHDGTAGRGALLHYPVINQNIGVRMAYTDADVATYGEDVYLLAAPVFIAAGESGGWQVEIDTTPGYGATPIVELYDSTGAQLASVLSSPSSTDSPGGVTHTAYLPSFASTGDVFYLFVRQSFEQDGTAWILHGWRLLVPAMGPPATWVRPETSAGLAVPTAGASEALRVEAMHDEYFANNYALAGHIVTKMNQNLMAFWEWLTGAPVPGNDAVNNADSGSTDPTTSRFQAHNRSVFSSEPMIDFPVLCEALGAVNVDGTMLIDATPATDGFRSWHAPFPVDTSGSTGTAIETVMPDFPASGADCSLKCAFLVANDTLKAAWSGNWQCRLTVGGSGSAWATLTQLGSLPFYVGTASFSSWLGADSSARVTLQTQLTSGSFTFGEFALLGYCLYFQP